jgi:hypothetical protein
MSGPHFQNTSNSLKEVFKKHDESVKVVNRKYNVIPPKKILDIVTKYSEHFIIKGIGKN